MDVARLRSWGREHPQWDMWKTTRDGPSNGTKKTPRIARGKGNNNKEAHGRRQQTSQSSGRSLWGGGLLAYGGRHTFATRSARGQFLGWLVRTGELVRVLWRVQYNTVCACVGGRVSRQRTSRIRGVLPFGGVRQCKLANVRSSNEQLSRCVNGACSPVGSAQRQGSTVAQ